MFLGGVLDVVRPDTRPSRPIVCDALAGRDVGVVHDLSARVDDRHACQQGNAAPDSRPDHLAVDGQQARQTSPLSIVSPVSPVPSVSPVSLHPHFHLLLPLSSSPAPCRV